MRTMKVIKFDSSRTMFNFAFIVAIFVTFLLCFTEDIYIDTSTMRVYSVWESMFQFNRTFMESNSSFCSLLVFEKTLSGYSAMFLPILASFPFVYSQSCERNSGNIRYTIFRTNKYLYYGSKFFCAVISGGLCIMLGVMLFGIFAFFVFPSPNESLSFDMAMYIPDGIGIAIMKKLFSAFIYGCANTLIAFFLTSFCRNRYIVLCIPFLIRFIQDTAIRKITMNIYNSDILQKIYPFQSYAVSQIPYLEAGKKLYSTLTFMLIYMALMLIGYILIMECRTDKGE